jgi:hypothetical protein
MRFPVKFTRYKGTPPANGIIFGADVLPVDVNGLQSNPNVNQDNVLNASMKNIDGWPPKRIAVACRYTGANDPSAVPLTGIMYFFDSLLGVWIAMSATGVTIQPGKADTLAHQPIVAFFDVVNISNQPSNSSNQQNAGAGSIAVCLIVTDPGTAVTGQYDFVMAASI